MSSMPVSHQVALTRQRSIGPPTHISNVTRQIVPPFLQKLYEMVNDPKNEELIRWSEAGDTFFVLDHERFANEVLGRWFKHRNFSSFVRQLNMYGFHKIPHLQQGVLKSDADKEFWNFAHASFKRGQPDLLCLIQRKKQTAQQEDGLGVPPSMDVRVEADVQTPTAGPSKNGAANTANTSEGALTLGSGQVLDIQSIVNGIAAIKRHQTTISAELNELKKSNQMLWQEAMTARNRHQKQQDTINKIVKFLAGMFGNHTDTNGEHARVVSVADDQEGVVSMGMGMNIEREQNAGHFIPRRQRLMIEAARGDGEDADMNGPRHIFIHPPACSIFFRSYTNNYSLRANTHTCRKPPPFSSSHVSPSIRAAPRHSSNRLGHCSIAIRPQWARRPVDPEPSCTPRCSAIRS
ncbi:hypothetical protein BDQ17DRAFT_306188 [Cyathus striatus]|nr:hypothetical protein BDQ17DRAFT_306188 [Cyathus striatus]